MKRSRKSRVVYASGLASSPPNRRHLPHTKTLEGIAISSRSLASSYRTYQTMESQKAIYYYGIQMSSRFR